MTEITEQMLRDYAEEAERDPHAPMSENATRPGWARAKVLSVRLNPEEYDELSRYAEAVKVPASSLVRGWILERVRTSSDSPAGTVERIARELEQLRRQLAA